MVFRLAASLIGTPGMRFRFLCHTDEAENSGCSSSPEKREEKERGEGGGGAVTAVSRRAFTTT